jgi:hypothetical protein
MSKLEYIQTAALLVASLALIVNAVFSILRYKHDKTSRNISSTMKLIEEWRSANARGAKDKITGSLAKNCDPLLGYTNLPVEYKTDVVTISHLCDEIATRVIYGEADERLILTFIGKRIITLWDVLEPYIENERKLSGVHNYQAHFQALARKSKKMNLDKMIENKVNRFLR